MSLSRDDLELLRLHCHGVQNSCQGILFVVHDTPLDRQKVGIPRMLQDQQTRPTAGFPDQEPHEEAEPVPIPAADLLKRIQNRTLRRLFITGEGGMGKTEFSRMLAFELANAALAALEHYAPNSPLLIPVWLPLKALETASELPALCHRTFSGISIPPNVHAHIVLILDGIDELSPSVQRSRFEKELQELTFSHGALVVTGRPGSLGPLASTFVSQDQYTLKPFSAQDINSYIQNYFQYTGNAARTPQLAAAISSCQFILRPMLQQPFLLALTCYYYADPTHEIRLPDDPGGLLEKCLRHLFKRRKVLQHLELSDDACLDSLGILFAHSIDFGYRISEPKAIQLLRAHAQITSEEAESRLTQLAPGSGILINITDDTYQFTNRVIAEFLAVRYIVSHGITIPNWPIPPHDPHQPLSIDDQILQVYSRYVWSVDHRNLLRWLALILGQKKPILLIRLVRWVVGHLAPEYEYHFGDDVHDTLRQRFLDLLSGLRDSPQSLPAELDDLTKCLYHIVSPQGDWYVRDNLRDSVYALSARLRNPYREALVAKLEHQQIGRYVESLTRALATGWPGDDNAGEALRAALQRQLDGAAVMNVADALVVGWPHDNKAAEALCARLRCEQERFALEHLTQILAAGWREHKTDACEALLARLRHETDVHAMEALAKALAAGWPGDEGVGQALHAKLQREKNVYAVASLSIALTAASSKYKAEVCESLRAKLRHQRDSYEMARVVEALAIIGWPRDEEVADALCAKLRHERFPFAVARLAEVLAIGWARDEHVARALCAKLEQEDNSWAVSNIAAALVWRWPDNQEVFGALLARLQCGKPPLGYVPGALAVGWPGDKKAAEALIGRLRQEEDGLAVSNLAEALATGWPGDKEVAEALRARLWHETNPHAVEGLAHALAAKWFGDKEAAEILRARLHYEPDSSVVERLAKALAVGWPEHKAEAGGALCARLQREHKRSAVQSLAETLAAGWPGDKEVAKALWQRLQCKQKRSTAARLARALAVGWPGEKEAVQAMYEKSHQRFSEWHPSWLLLLAPNPHAKSQLIERAARCHWQFPIHDLHAPISSHDLGKSSPPCDAAFILGSREQFWPGLDPILERGDLLYAGTDLIELAKLLMTNRADQPQGRVLLALIFLSRAQHAGTLPGKKGNVTEEGLWRVLRDLNEDTQIIQQNEIELQLPWPLTELAKNKVATFKQLKNKLVYRVDLGSETHKALQQLFEKLGHYLRPKPADDYAPRDTQPRSAHRYDKLD